VSAARPARPRWTLRRRLVAVVVALLATVAAVMGLVSTLALRSSLMTQVDTRLRDASTRAADAPSRLGRGAMPGQLPSGAPADGSGDGAQDGSGDGTQDGTGDGAQDGTGDGQQPGGGSIPPAFGLPGQDVGTVSVFETADGTPVAGYLDESGDVQGLTDEQLAVLLAVEPGQDPGTVDLPDLGTYRAIAVESDNGSTSVTAVPLAGITATVDDYIVVEVVVAALGLLVAAALATVLVRRELRPLDRVAATATRVSEMPLSRGEVDIRERVPDEDTDPATEVGQVGSALNRMLGHVESALTARHESETQVRRFVADASHELRTPLASIRGYAELVQRLPGDLPDDVVRAMGRVESEARRMTSLVEDMLLLARLDAGRDLDTEEVDLAALAVDAVADAHVAGPDHVWRLDLGALEGAGDDAGADDDEGAEPALVVGDEHRLRQVLVNLLSNARVHTPAGTTVVVAVAREGDRAVLRVRDDGPGIAEPLRSRLFERFARGDASRNRAAGSTGLGLAIVHAVVTAHGGTIEVEGTPGATTFTVRLPLVGAPDALPVGAAGAPGAGGGARRRPPRSGGDVRQRGDLVVRQLEGRAGQQVGQLLDRAGARDRRDDAGLHPEPGEAHGGDRRAVRGRDRVQRGQHPAPAVVEVPARRPGARAVHGGRPVAVLAGEEAAGQRGVRQDAEALAHGELLQRALVGAPVHQVVVRLQGDEPGDPELVGDPQRLGQPLGREVRGRDVPGLAVGDDLAERGDRLLQRGLLVVLVRVVQVDVVGAEPLERVVDRRPDDRAGRAAAGAELADLRGDHDVRAVAAGRHPAADRRLGLAALVAVTPLGVDVRGVDEAAAGLGERVQDGERGLLVRGPAEHVAAQVQRQDVQVGGADACHGPPRSGAPAGGTAPRRAPRGGGGRWGACGRSRRRAAGLRSTPRGARAPGGPRSGRGRRGGERRRRRGRQSGYAA
jgi:two-component system OmpR family sensor kinase